MTLTRRTFFKAAAVAAVGLALPQTELITDAEEIARHYWALDKTHLASASEYVTTHLTSESEYDAAYGHIVAADTFTPPDTTWWRIGQVVSENRYMTSLRFDPDTTLPSTLRAGDTIELGDLGKNGIYHGGLERQDYIIRHVDHANGLVTVEVPAYHEKNTFSATLTFDDPVPFAQPITPLIMESNRVTR